MFTECKQLREDPRNVYKMLTIPGATVIVSILAANRGTKTISSQTVANIRARSRACGSRDFTAAANRSVRRSLLTTRRFKIRPWQLGVDKTDDHNSTPFTIAILRISLYQFLARFANAARRCCLRAAVYLLMYTAEKPPKYATPRNYF